MADYVTLMGAEDVSKAGTAMRSVAQDISNSVSNLDVILMQNRVFMDDWLARFEYTVNQLIDKAQGRR